MIIKSRDIFFIINEVSYVLALSNETQQIVEMVLDRLMPLLKLDCSWVQLLDPEAHDLRLVACRGFTPEMVRVVGLPGSKQGHISQVAMGLHLVIPDLARDGSYGLASFGQAGLRSLIAVPIRTYRTHGVLGIASRARKRFPRGSDELLTVIAGMVGTAINSAELGKVALASQERRLATLNRPSLRRNYDEADDAGILQEEVRSNDCVYDNVTVPAAVTNMETGTVGDETESDGWHFNKAVAEAGFVRDEEPPLAKDMVLSAPGARRLNDEDARRIGRDMLRASLASLGQSGRTLIGRDDGDGSAGQGQVSARSKDFNHHARKMTVFRSAHRVGKTTKRGKP